MHSVYFYINGRNSKIRATTSLKSNMQCHTAPDPIINQDKLLYVKKKCINTCIICPYIEETKLERGKEFTWKIESSVSWQSYNIVYMLKCTKKRCNRKYKYRYIGETERTLKERVSEHIGYIHTKKLSEPAGAHFNTTGHSKSDMKVLILEKVINFDTEYGKERESHHIRRFNTFHSGLNKKP